MNIGYIRVSTAEQNLDLQRDALERSGIDRLYQDKISGATKSRPGLDQMLEVVRPGDTVKIWKLDRLGRGALDTIRLINQLSDQNVRIISLTENIDSTNPMGKMILYISSIFAEMELENIKRRTREGLAAARARGRSGGRPSAMSAAQIAQARKLYETDTPINEICDTFGISRATLYRHLKK